MPYSYTIIKHLFNFVTTTFCWGVMETEPGKYRFSEDSEEIYRRPPSDRALRFAKENNLTIKGQPLFVGRWLPDWVPHDFEQLKAFWIRFVREVAKRYDGKFYLFDVVNESYQDDGSWQNMSWLPVSYSEFTKWMLQTAGEIFSKNCKMERNESNHVNFGAYGDKYFEENKSLLDAGVRLDSIGFQYHLFNGDACLNEHITGDLSLESIYKTYHKMSTLGVPMYITEITIPTVYSDMTQEEGEDLQANVIEKLYRLWFSIPQMAGIVYWNLSDGDAWPGEELCRGCLLDQNMRKKKAYHTLERLIKEEWNTSLSMQTNQDGTAEFRGFYGSYELSVQANGTTSIHTATFDKKSNTCTITL